MSTLERDEEGEGGGGRRFPSRRTDTRAVGLTRMSFRTCDLKYTGSQRAR